MDIQEPSPSAIAVEVSNTQSHLPIDPGHLAGVVRRVLAAEGVARAEVSLVVVDDPTIRAINRRHLDHDWATDVITFPLSDPDDPELSGEIVLSAETAVRAGREAGVGPLDELTLYLVHGLLHLLGHDDLEDEPRALMRRREAEVLGRLGLGDVFGGRPTGRSSC